MKNNADARRSQRRSQKTVWLSRAELLSLATLARHLGFLQSRGAGTGQLGSYSQLLQAIAAGDVVLVPGWRWAEFLEALGPDAAEGTSAELVPGPRAGGKEQTE